VRFFIAYKHLFFTQTINQLCILLDYSRRLPTIRQVFDPTLEEISQFDREEIVESILELSVVVEGNSAQIIGEKAEEVVIRWGKVRRVGEMLKNLPVEVLNKRFRHVCDVRSDVIMLKNHSMSPTRALLLDCFLQTAKLLTIAFSSDGQVPLKQFMMDNPLHIPPDPQHGSPEGGVSLMSILLCLKLENHFWAVLQQ
jgi:hypothetical protein